MLASDLIPLGLPGHAPPPTQPTPAWRAASEARIRLANTVLQLAKVGSLDVTCIRTMYTQHGSGFCTCGGMVCQGQHLLAGKSASLLLLAVAR